MTSQNEEEQPTNLLSEFQKLQSETEGISEIFGKKANVSSAGLVSNSMLQEIQKEQKEFKEEVMDTLKLMQDSIFEGCEDMKQEMIGLKGKQDEMQRDMMEIRKEVVENSSKLWTLEQCQNRNFDNTFSWFQFLNSRNDSMEKNVEKIQLDITSCCEEMKQEMNGLKEKQQEMYKDMMEFKGKQYEMRQELLEVRRNQNEVKKEVVENSSKFSTFEENQQKKLDNVKLYLKAIKAKSDSNMMEMDKKVELMRFEAKQHQKFIISQLGEDFKPIRNDTKEMRKEMNNLKNQTHQIVLFNNNRIQRIDSQLNAKKSENSPEPVTSHLHTKSDIQKSTIRKPESFKPISNPPRIRLEFFVISSTKFDSNRSIKLTMKSYSTVKEVKKLIAWQEGCSPDDFYLIYNDKPLDNTALSLHEHGITNDSIIRMKLHGQHSFS